MDHILTEPFLWFEDYYKWIITFSGNLGGKGYSVTIDISTPGCCSYSLPLDHPISILELSRYCPVTISIQDNPVRETSAEMTEKAYIPVAL